MLALAHRSRSQIICGNMPFEVRPTGLGISRACTSGIVVNPGMNAADPDELKRDGYALFSYVEISPISRFDDALK